MACPPFKTITPAAKWCHHLPSDNLTLHHCHDMQALQQDWDWYIPIHPAYSPNWYIPAHTAYSPNWYIPAHPAYNPNSVPYGFLLFSHIKPFEGMQIESADTLITGISEALCLLSRNEYRMQLISCHIGGRSAKFLEIIMLSCIVLCSIY